LGIAMLVSALLSNIIMVNDNVAATTRVTYAMAKDNLLPRFFGKLHRKYKTPTWGTVLMMAVAVIVTLTGSFEILVEFQTFVFFATYVMLIVAGVALRIKEPGLPRPFRIPFGTGGIILYCVPVVLICLYAIISSGLSAIIGAVIFGVAGPLTYLLFKKMYGGIEKAPMPLASAAGSQDGGSQQERAQDGEE
jgi:APA family basic amino acid/polyamine antiporter